MKKYFLVLLLIIFAVPSIALASWWNPFSWKIFHKKEVAPQVQVEIQKTPEEKITELQKQLDDLKKQKSSSVSTPTTPVEKKEVKKLIPVVANSVTTKPETTKIVVDVCLEIEGIQDIVPIGYIKYGSGPCVSLKPTTTNQNIILDTPPPLVIDICLNIEGVQTTVPSGLKLQNNNCVVPTKVSSLVISQGETSVDTTGSGGSRTNIKFINDFNITNNSEVPIFVNSITYKLTSSGLILKDNYEYRQRMSLGVRGSTIIPDYIDYQHDINEINSNYLKVTKTFDLPITITASGSKTFTFIYNPAEYVNQAVNPYLQVEIQEINTSPISTNNLPISNRAIQRTSY
ncbi:hypothetical protein COU49_02560 [Candidatus Nomurabacteria bacterium CG10_big_fil_rev_8_21_14_0_10_35_16]|uniref:Uncharacterized protein n=1 Tax=Candidatus Nomurabacteria bacterium CG10_big_fil_rev_8_21_14_0_10_35_16 TaxID=1974731 RepID=A0A2H0TB33_9BACT|nr:MAG: hypothetical protein COU49_02560 [Candidatus Nomurabacteria bacterium CG10_big_fil_rev_8_21_14_0_10_35_16]